MFTHLAWIWWAADPVQLMLHTRDEMERLRRWRIPHHKWEIITPRVQAWVCEKTKTMPVEEFARRAGKSIHTHILYDIILPEIRPVEIEYKYVRFENTLRT
jgi:hypothetical protein